MKNRKEPKNIFTYHQIKIAKKTLQLSDIGAKILGSMTKEEARAILKQNYIKFMED